MKKPYALLVISIPVAFLLTCSKPKVETIKPRLYITLKDDLGKAVSGATVKLYKNENGPGITQLSDTTGVVIFSDLDTTTYHWLAQKACMTNRISQTTLNRPLVPNVILYGYSVMTETGALKIINNSTENFKVSDSLFNTTIKKDTPYFAFRRVSSYKIHWEKLTTPPGGKDTIVTVRCNDTTVLNLPY